MGRARRDRRARSVRRSGTRPSLDRRVSDWFVDQRTDDLNVVTRVFSLAGDTYTVIAIAIARRGRRRWCASRREGLVVLVVGMLGEVTIFLTLTALVSRAAPDVAAARRRAADVELPERAHVRSDRPVGHARGRRDAEPRGSPWLRRLFLRADGPDADRDRAEPPLPRHAPPHRRARVDRPRRCCGSSIVLEIFPNPCRRPAAVVDAVRDRSSRRDVSTAQLVPETWELDGDDAARDVAAGQLQPLLADAVTRFRSADGMSHARSLAFAMILTIIPGIILVVGIAAAHRCRLDHGLDHRVPDRASARGRRARSSRPRSTRARETSNGSRSAPVDPRPRRDVRLRLHGLRPDRARREPDLRRSRRTARSSRSTGGHWCCSPSYFGARDRCCSCCSRSARASSATSTSADRSGCGRSAAC